MAYEEDKRSADRYRQRETAQRRTSASSGSSRQQDRQGGHKKRRRIGLAGSLIYIAFVIGLSTLLATVGWIWASDVLALNKDYKTAVIEITEDESLNSVVKDLTDEGIVEHGWLFKLFCKISSGEDKITAGSYTLNTEMDYRAIVNNLGSSSSSKTQISVTIPEGYTIDQIFALLAENNVSTVDKLEDTAANHDYDFSFLEDLDLGDYKRLEGYLFPDTYNFYVGEDPIYVINKMLVNFDSKVTDSMRQQITENGYSIHDIIIIASMIEKETDGTDRTSIASVIENRLNSSFKYLQIDATIAYVTGNVVTEDDYKSVDSPYNTYLYEGLPPGPIANPGSESILAAINPDDTSYYYYILGDDGKHHFFSSYEKFKAYKATLSSASSSG
ncbi:MAG: YceG like protein [Oscillospiraceae bacterium]|nr:YceG like protein [Oscillospiraceae bacterium]